MDRISFRKKITLMIFGIFLSVIMLEAGLRLAGRMYLAWQDYQNSRALKKEDKGEYRIVCLGESTTAFGGENSYPQQLERILNEKIKDKRFVVINKGIPAIDTAGILSELEHTLSRYSPRMVIAMMGINDGADSHPLKSGVIPKIKSFIKTFRVYKAAKLLWGRIHSAKELKKAYFENGKYHLERRDYYEAEQLFKKAMRIKPIGPADYVWLGECYYKQGLKAKAEEIFRSARGFNFLSAQDCILAGRWYFDMAKVSEAQEMFKRAITLKPGDYVYYVEAAQFYHDAGFFSQAREMYRKALELAGPGNKDSWPYSAFGWHYFERNRFAEAEYMFHKALEMNSDDPGAYRDLAFVKQSQGLHQEARKYFDKADACDGWNKSITVKNYNRLKDIVLRRGIKLVCVQYPTRPLRDLKEMFNSLEGITFVDNERIFKDALAGGRFEDYFVDKFAFDFGHCTPKGNSLLAHTIAEAIVKEYFSAL